VPTVLLVLEPYFRNYFPEMPNKAQGASRNLVDTQPSIGYQRPSKGGVLNGQSLYCASGHDVETIEVLFLSDYILT
jgi:hypothetical protein